MFQNSDELENKSNNEILFEIKKLEVEHEAIKIRMVKDFDLLVEIEKQFDRANKILLKRLGGNR